MPNEGFPVQALRREERLPERVARQLQNLIFQGVIKTGVRLPTERELAEMFGVSRTVIREAIHSLAARGLLEVRTGGTYVSSPCTESVTQSLGLLLRFRAEGFLVEHLREARRVLEAEIAERAAERATEEDIADMEDILRRTQEALDDRDAVAKADVEFHRALAVSTHNPLYLILLESISDLLMEIRRISLQDTETMQRALHHHRDVFERVKSRNPDAARRAMDAHMDQADDSLRSILAARGQPETLFQPPDMPSQEAG